MEGQSFCLAFPLLTYPFLVPHRLLFFVSNSEGIFLLSNKPCGSLILSTENKGKINLGITTEWGWGGTLFESTAAPDVDKVRR